jgi:hypothetical protein
MDAMMVSAHLLPEGSKQALNDRMLLVAEGRRIQRLQL